jgi:predicted RNA-binding protein with RPS1 domain
MIFESIINWIKKGFGISDKEGWITARINEIESHRDNFDTLPFKIVDLKDNGFLTKVKGLYSYISFYHMPWKYLDPISWSAVAPSLIDKKFFCKIHKIHKDPVAIILNGELPQFKKVELTFGEKYKGLIIKILEFGVFIDIGYHFDWKCGSLTGLLHKSQFAENERIDDFKLGQEIETFYQTLNKDGRIVFCNDQVNIDWQLGKPQELVGKVILAKVIRKTENKKVSLLIEGKYKANLETNNKISKAKNRTNINQFQRDLAVGKLIECEVTGFNERKKCLNVNLLVDYEADSVVGNSIQSNLDIKTIQKLINLKHKI